MKFFRYLCVFLEGDEQFYCVGEKHNGGINKDFFFSFEGVQNLFLGGRVGKNGGVYIFFWGGGKKNTKGPNNDLV